MIGGEDACKARIARGVGASVQDPLYTNTANIGGDSEKTNHKPKERWQERCVAREMRGRSRGTRADLEGRIVNAIGHAFNSDTMDELESSRRSQAAHQSVIWLIAHDH